MKDELKQIFSYFPDFLRNRFYTLDTQILDNLEEIRFRVNRPCCLCVNAKNIIASSLGIFSQKLINDIFISFCENSVYSYQDDINRGFITISGGHRVGICGQAVFEHGKAISVKNISSLNIRVAHQIIGCADRIVKLNARNIIIVGPPSSGKTTLLRDYARTLSNSFHKVCIVDERNEITASVGGEPMFDIGMMSDAVIGCSKAQGINQAIRTLSPQTIIFDEIGTNEEYESLKDCFNSGVNVVTSVHSYCKNEFFSRTFCKKLVELNFFEIGVFLGRTRGEIIESMGLKK